MPCRCCEITDNTFTGDSARSDIKKYRKQGPAKQTRLILEGVRSLGLKDVLLLDVGGGIGAIHHELLKDTAREAIHVDASSAYLKEAEQESTNQGNSGRVKFIHADFTDIAAGLPRADVVTLDRVVCCYPDFHSLLNNAAEHSSKGIALSYPREVWYVRLVLRIINFLQRLRRDPFRVFVHPVREMNDVLVQRGFTRVTMKRLAVWEMALYQRTGV